jgi:hypothetical protein
MEVKKMRIKTTLVVTVGMVVLLATLFVTTGISVASTPLFTVRMEQVCSDMNFVPDLVIGFSYMTEKGHDLKCNSPSCDISSSGTLGTTLRTCDPCIKPTPAPTGPVSCEFT